MDGFSSDENILETHLKEEDSEIRVVENSAVKNLQDSLLQSSYQVKSSNTNKRAQNLGFNSLTGSNWNTQAKSCYSFKLTNKQDIQLEKTLTELIR